jgi:hypothetical protein
MTNHRVSKICCGVRDSIPKILDMPINAAASYIIDGCVVSLHHFEGRLIEK